MPYASENQRRFMYSQRPDIAKRWDAEGKNYIKGGGRSDRSAKAERKSQRSRRKSR